MKKKEEPLADVGVLVGRFQVHELHDAHIDLIQSVCKLHDKVIVFLGLSPLRVTRNNPLDFESRKQMLLEKFPNINVLYIKDTSSDSVWSKNLDRQIDDLIGPTQTVMLYGSRDSFISHYSGRFPATELLQEVYISGTEVRKSIGKKVKNTPEFRAGVIWAAYNQFHKVHATVDIAILSQDMKNILLARKPDETLYRFVGGFSDPLFDESYEAAAKRELTEEAGNIETSPMEYVCSMKVNDWRYRAESDKIITTFFFCKHLFGKPEPGDDICEIRWFGLDMAQEYLIPSHKILMEKLIGKINTQQN